MSDVETPTDSVPMNPFQPPATPEPPPPPEAPLAEYLARIQGWSDAYRRMELFEDRLVSWTTFSSGDTIRLELPLSAFRRDPDSVWSRSVSLLPHLGLVVPAVLVSIPLTAAGGPCSGLGGGLACLTVVMGLWTAADQLGPLTQPKAAGVAFQSKEGGELLTFLEFTPGDPEFSAFVQKLMEAIDRARPPAPPFGIDGPLNAAPSRETQPDTGPPSVVYVEPRAAWSGPRRWRLFADRVEVESDEGCFHGGRSRIDLEKVVPRPERTYAHDFDRHGWARLAALAAAATWFALLCGATWNVLGLPWYERPWFFLSAGIPMLLMSILLRIGVFLVPRRACLRFSYENGLPALILFRPASRAANVDAFAEAVSRQAEACRTKAAGR